MATPKNNFINRIKGYNPTAPTSNVGATPTNQTVIQPPKTTLPPAGKTFVQSLYDTATGGRTEYGKLQGVPDMLGGKPVETKAPPVAETPKQPSQKDAYISAYKSYIDSLKESADVKEAKQAYNDYVANIAKSKAGLEGQGRGIPLQIVRGQQEKLLGQTQPEAQRLLGEIGIAQDTQKATQESLKAGLDFEGKLLDDTKPIEVGGQLYQKQPDGTYISVAGGKGGEGFTLSKDQVRYDAQGNIIAGGFTGVGTGDANVDAWVKGIQSGVYKPSDVPEALQGAVAQALTTTEKPQSEISKQVVSVIDELLLNPGLSRISGLTDQFLGGLTGDAALAKNKYNQLKGLLSLENIKYLKGTGAISDAEQRLLANAASAIGRNLSDADFRNELVKLKNGLATVKDNTLAPDEEEFLRSQGYSQSEIDALKTSFNSVGNTRASNVPQRNKNPGNIKQGGLADRLAIGVDNQGHLIFPDEQTGFRAMQMDLQAKINGQSRYLKPNPTLQELGKVYAEDPNWTRSVSRILGVSPNTKTKDIPIEKLTQAIARQEGYYA